MTAVVVTFRVLPDDAEADLGALMDRVREAFGDRLRDLRERPLAFGLVSLETAVLLEDAAGEVDRCEETLRGLDGVRSVETLSVDLL